MKQIIYRKPDGTIRYKHYENHLDQKHGLYMFYYYSGKINWKSNYINGKLYGLSTWYYSNDKIEKQKYYL